VTALLEFECCRPVGGYRLISFDLRKLERAGWAIYGEERPTDLTDDEQQFIDRWGGPELLPDGSKARIVSLVVPQSRKLERFDLFESAPGMFLEFAHTPRTPDGVKAFADRFGGLTDGMEPEQVDLWYRPIAQMRRAVAAWDEAKSTANLGKVIRIIRRRARGRILAEFVQGEEGIAANILLKKDLARKSARLCIRPAGRLDALWIQLTLAIDGNQNLRPCAECHSWFPIESGGARSDKEYCSDACRMRAYRRRKTKRGASEPGQRAVAARKRFGQEATDRIAKSLGLSAGQSSPKKRGTL
jgi:hypothetical protein